jgi:hypothetical protein
MSGVYGYNININLKISEISEKYPIKKGYIWDKKQIF